MKSRKGIETAAAKTEKIKWLGLSLMFLRTLRYIHRDSGGKVNILGGNSASHYEKKKKVHINMCLNLNGC